MCQLAPDRFRCNHSFTSHVLEVFALRFRNKRECESVRHDRENKERAEEGRRGKLRRERERESDTQAGMAR